MFKSISGFFSRLRVRFGWVADVSRHMGGDTKSKIKLFFGGLWFLVNDSWKTNLTFTATVSHFGCSSKFHFKDLSDFGLFCEIFIEAPYSSKRFHDVSTIFDLGANVGVSALYFRLLYPDSTIYSFEPDPQNVSQLKRNADYLGNINIYEIAVGATDDQISFYVDPHRGSSSSTQKIRDRQQKITVQTKALDTILEELNLNKIDILKFDIEGSEEKVFSAFSNFDLVRILFGEIHGDLCNAENTIDTIKKNYKDIELHPLDIEDRWYLTAHNS